jgi:chaperonin GroES
MAMEKGLYQAPEGIEALADQPDIEIEIVNPEEVHIGMDGLEIDMVPAGDEDFGKNLAEDMPESVLTTLSGELLGDFEEDLSSRKDWIQTYVDGLELLGLKIETRSEPWEGACGVYHPLMAEALVKFQSEMMMATFPAAGPVKTQIIGKETPEKKAAAERVQNDMNYQLTDVMTEYRPEHERMLWGLGLSGNAFKKVYFDHNLDRQVSIFVPAEDLVVPYGASNLQSAERVTHVMRKTENDVRRLQVSGFWRDVDLGEPDIVLDEVEKKIAEKLGFRATTDDRHKILEMCVDLDLEGYEHKDEDGEPTGIAIPYIVTIDKSSGKVLAIRRNWEQDDELHTKLQHFVHYGYVPGFGFYHFGLVHLVGAFAKSGTSLLRQLVDAGTLSNLPGGFKARGMRVKGDDTPIAPGEFRDVDVPSGTIKDNLMTLPYKEPSQTLLALLNQIIEDGRRFANAADLQISDMSSQAPVGTTLAILERTLKVMSAVQARIHYSMQQELVLLKEIIAESAVEDYDYDPDSGSRRAKKSDYENVDVIPVSDPNAATMAQKIVQYQAVLQLAQSAPQMYNMPLLHRQMLDVLGIKNAQKLIPMSDDQKPMDPVSENQNILAGKPVKAFLYQDHEAHITVHMTAMQDPKIQQLLQGNPMAQQMQAQMMAHINEHLGFEYRKQIEQQLGMNLPPQHDEAGEDIQLDPMVEARLAPLLAQASKQLLQVNQAQVAQQQAQQQAQDPIVQMQQQELQIKMAEQQRKVQKDQADVQLRMKQLEIEHERILAQTKVSEQQAKLSALKSVAEQQNQRKMEELRLKQDSIKTVANLENQRIVNKQRLYADGLKAAHTIHKEEPKQETKPTKGEE